MVVVMVMLTELLRVFMGFEDCARGVTEKKLERVKASPWESVWHLNTGR